MSSFQEEFVIFCIQEDSATVMMECSLNLKIVWQHWSFQYDRVAKSQRFSRFRTMSNQHVFCVNLRFVFYETSEASTVVHDIRQFLFFYAVAILIQVKVVFVGPHLSPQNFFCFLEGAHKTFCFLDMANTGAHSMMLHKMLHCSCCCRARVLFELCETFSKNFLKISASYLMAVANCQLSTDYVGLHFSLQNHLSAIKQTHGQNNFWPIKLSHCHIQISQAECCWVGSKPVPAPASRGGKVG